MVYLKQYIRILLASCSFLYCSAVYAVCMDSLMTGADQTAEYLPYLRHKRVGFVVNSNSLIAGQHVVDSLLKAGIHLVRGFGPERNFRGVPPAEAPGVQSDEKTKIPLVRLYGDKWKPSMQDMDDIDVVIYDAQDIGVRCYIYLHTLHHVMEACAESGKELIVLDRPNPIGSYVDGPVLDKRFQSPLGMHPIPMMHGLTIGEYARMINGEGWLANGLVCKLKVITMKNYRRNNWYALQNAPFPNLNSQRAVIHYPSLCLFDGTVISQGRGTPFPFTVLGHPKLKDSYAYSFIPIPIAGMSANPPYEGEPCYGLDLKNGDVFDKSALGKLNLAWLIQLYADYPDKDEFFVPTKFDNLAGTSELRRQLMDRIPEEQIRSSWKPALEAFKQIRKNYLIY